MFSRHAAVLCGLAFALAACADSPANRTITAPDAGPTLDVAAAPADITVTDLATGDGLVVAADVGTEQAATGGRATGHADVTSGPRSDKYSFSALSTGDFPNAKGRAEVHITGPLGRTNVHLEVDCLAITGNNAWVSGPVTKWRINGEDVPIPPGLQGVLRVEDNGEGGTTVDAASRGVAFFGTQVCRFRPPLVLLPSDDGNIQVSQR
jgi:hypothetical protein